MKKGDIVLVPFPSIIKLTKLVTLDKHIILGKLGALNLNILKGIDRNLATLFQLR